VEEAERQLKFLPKKAAKPILKLLNSAVANAQHNVNLAKEGLYIANIIVDAGPILKRWRARAMGRATPIMKRTSHITLVLDQKEPLPGVAPKEIPSQTVETELPSESKKIETKPVQGKAKPAVKEKEEPELLKEMRKTEEEKTPVPKPKPVPPPRPYPTTSQSKKRFFSRQTFGNVKKMFRRKSI
jgi:large subunit ribosomal protein L22